ETPRSQFVADVLGDSNFLPVTSWTEESGQVVADVLDQPLIVASNHGPLSSPVLLVRPDWIELNRADQGGATFDGTLLSREYYGGFERCAFEVAGVKGQVLVDLNVVRDHLPEVGELC